MNSDDKKKGSKKDDISGSTNFIFQLLKTILTDVIIVIGSIFVIGNIKVTCIFVVIAAILKGFSGDDKN